MREENTYDEIFQYCFSRLIVRLQSDCNMPYHDAEDLAMEVMLLLHQKWDTLHHHTCSAMMTWSLSVAHNLLKNKYRCEKSKPSVVSFEQITEKTELADDEVCSAESKQEDEDFFARIERQLSPKEQMIFMYKVRLDLSFDDISSRTGIPIKALYHRWDRLKKKLRRIVDHSSVQK